MTLTKKNLDTPDDRLEFPRGMANVVTVDSVTVGRGLLEPGWRWSNDVAPLVGMPSCQLPHVGTLFSGVLHVEMDDGETIDLQPGDVYVISPGHDAWVVGDEPVRTLEWSGTAGGYIDPHAHAENAAVAAAQASESS
jgi:hypothetical protein